MKIISGGQTGVDRGGLDAALAAGVECGGWCPAGRVAENGRIPDCYPLTELPGAGYAERTMRNVADADGTLIVTFGEPQGGTRATVECCIEEQKPLRVIDASRTSVGEAVTMARAFVDAYRIRTLNVAGPRASEAPTAHDYAHRVISGLLEQS